ncbi:MAG: 23S rRNA (adenine(2503)-C(2))-methyltransferase RlmN [Limnochordales bacterium]|nr:23S rRNA (adenine(2503)-C(2))-methyltransferase RlmN [Limnochordales bacterium]
MTQAEIEELLSSWGEPRYRARQVWEWIHRHLASDWEEMTNLPRQLRERFAAETELYSLAVVERRAASDGTTKYLFRLQDGETVESVWIPAGNRGTVCVSTQVGCALGCRFCATALSGLRRNLRAAEIVDQVRWISHDLRRRASNVVFMGMGEPLANFVETRKALAILHEPTGLNIGWRHITISTSGLVPAIRRLAAEGLPLTLAVSLHAADNKTRTWLMPINRHYPLEELLPACREWVERVGRRVTFEYVLIDGVNDSISDARRLSRLISGMLAHVNLIPLNPIPEIGWRASSPAKQQAFARVLEDSGIPVTLRQERGAEIEAACGQLRRRRLLEVTAVEV